LVEIFPINHLHFIVINLFKLWAYCFNR